VANTFTVNGVTTPFARSEAVINDQDNYAVFDSFNGMIPNGWDYHSGIVQIAREYLWYANYATGELIPWLGERWEYNEDYTELRLYLRKGVTWNDGEPFTAADVVWTLSLAMDPEYDDLGLPHSDADYWSKVYAADDYTVVIEMTEPRPRQHLHFWCTIIAGVSILPEHIWADVDPHTFKNNPPVFTGPYKLFAVYPENKVFVWVRNEDYWGRSRGYFPAARYVIYRTGPTGDQLLSEVQDNLADITSLSYDQYQINKAHLPQIEQVTYVDPCPRGVWFNCGKEPHLTQPEFRRAMSMLMDRETWAANIWSPTSKPAEGLWADYDILDPYINEEAKATWGTLDYDPERALELLRSIGYTQEEGKLLGPDGQQVALSITTPWGVGSGEYLMGLDFAEELRSVGIDATFDYVESVFWEKEWLGEFDIEFYFICGADIDPFEGLYRWFPCDHVVPIGEPPPGYNPYRYCNEAFDRAVEALKLIGPEDPAAHELYMRLFDLWMQDPPAVPTIETYYSRSFNTTYWDGMPSMDNLYTVPFNWWGQILFVYFNITPSGR